jgi:hypothetical protein
MSHVGHGLTNHHPGPVPQDYSRCTPSSGPSRWFIGEWRCVSEGELGDDLRRQVCLRAERANQRARLTVIRMALASVTAHHVSISRRREFNAHAASGRCIFPGKCGSELLHQQSCQPRAQPLVLVHRTPNAIVLDDEVQ